MLVGVAGWARSGKDTVGSILVNRGFEKVAFAEKLREFVEHMNPIIVFFNERVCDESFSVRWNDVPEDSRYRLAECLRLEAAVGEKMLEFWPDGEVTAPEFIAAINPIVLHVDEEAKPVRYLDIKALVGYERAKDEYEEFRRTLIRTGTEAGRELIGDDVWVDALMASLDPESNYTMTDVRFPNEADAIRANNGMVWWVSRPGVGPANDHASENSLADYDFDLVICNDGTLEELESQVVDCL